MPLPVPSPARRALSEVPPWCAGSSITHVRLAGGQRTRHRPARRVTEAERNIIRLGASDKYRSQDVYSATYWRPTHSSRSPVDQTGSATQRSAHGKTVRRKHCDCDAAMTRHKKTRNHRVPVVAEEPSVHVFPSLPTGSSAIRRGTPVPGPRFGLEVDDESFGISVLGLGGHGHQAFSRPLRESSPGNRAMTRIFVRRLQEQSRWTGGRPSRGHSFRQ